MMDVEEELYQMRVRLEIRINRQYMAAVSRLHQVDIRTVYIWHATGIV